MEPEVRLVEIWLNSQNFLTMTNVGAKGGKEIDILGIQVENGELKKRRHVEVSCWSGGSLSRTSGHPKGTKFNNPSEVAEYFADRKFNDHRIVEKVSSILGSS